MLTRRVASFVRFVRGARTSSRSISYKLSSTSTIYPSPSLRWGSMLICSSTGMDSKSPPKLPSLPSLSLSLPPLTHSLSLSSPNPPRSDPSPSCAETDREPRPSSAFRSRSRMLSQLRREGRTRLRRRRLRRRRRRWRSVTRLIRFPWEAEKGLGCIRW